MMSITTYIESLKANKLSEATINNYKYVLERIHTTTPPNKMSASILKQLFSSLEVPESTFSLFQIVVKKYYKDNKRDSVVDWIKIKTVKNDIDPNSILTREDINLMIKTTDSIYYKALISFLFESGVRFGECFSLKWTDFQETNEGIIANIRTKKTRAGYRKIILPESTPYLKNLKTYSYSKHDEQVFYISLSPTNLMFKRIAKKAGINKPLHAHSFRHACATDMVKRGFNESIIRQKLGWTASSNMIERYIHLNDTSIIDAQLKLDNRIQEHTTITRIEEPEPLKLVKTFDILQHENEDLRIEVYQ